MKKSKIVGVIGAAVVAIGAAIGIGALVKRGKNEECDNAEACEEECYEEDDSEE